MSIPRGVTVEMEDAKDDSATGGREVTEQDHGSDHPMDERSISDHVSPGVATSSSREQQPPACDAADRQEQRQIASTENRLANLAIQDNRRRGGYGADAFGIPPQTPSVNTRGLLLDPSEKSPLTTQHHDGDSNRPHKIPKTDRNSFAHALPAQNAELTENGGATDGQILTALEDDDQRSTRVDGMSNLLLQQRTKTELQNKAGTDLDRDDEGNLIENDKRTFSVEKLVRSSTQHLLINETTCNPQGTAQRATKKRKQAAMTNDLLPSPAFVWRGAFNFNSTVFQGFLLYPELCFLLATHLPLRDLISLYSISRDFHAIIDTRFTTVCLSIATQKAPESAKTFHFRMYASLCRPDPANRVPHPDPRKAANRQPRMIPSFRWVAFVLHREKAVHELMAVFAEKGVPLPSRCQIALKRMWLLMDIPDNGRRIGLMHNRNLISNTDLYFMFCFFVKLDMVCHDPVAVEKHDGLRKLMLSQRNGLMTVLQVLKRLKWKRQADLLIAWVKHSCEIPGALVDEDFDAITFGAETIFGVPVEQAGLGKYEYWGNRGAVRCRPVALSTTNSVAVAAEPQGGADSAATNGGNVATNLNTIPATSAAETTAGPVMSKLIRYQVLLRPDQLVMREAVRRGLSLSKVVLKAMLTEYVDPTTMTSLPPRPFPRRIPEWNDEEYEVDDAIGGALATNVHPHLGVGHGINGGGVNTDVIETLISGDPLLDLGDPHQGTPLIVGHQQSSSSALRRSPEWLAKTLREQEDRFLDMCLKYADAECRQLERSRVQDGADEEDPDEVHDGNANDNAIDHGGDSEDMPILQSELGFGLPS